MYDYKQFQIKLKEHFQKVSNKKRKCSHPNCNERAINSHTVSKASNLLKISFENHVYQIENPIFNINNNSLINFKLAGVKHEASVYPLFCKDHDDELFKPFEKNNRLEITQEHSFLLQYRITSKELLVNQNIYETYSNIIYDLEETIQQYEEFINYLIEIKRIFELRSEESLNQKNNLDKLLTKSDFSKQNYYAIIIDKIPEIQCSTTWIPTLDFDNNELFDLDNHTLPVPSISIDILAFEEKGIILFSWNSANEYTYSEVNIKFIKSLDNIVNTEKPMAILHLIFSFNENIFISPIWWDSLEDNKKEILKGIQPRAIKNMNILKDYKILENFVDWNVIDIKTNIEFLK